MLVSRNSVRCAWINAYFEGLDDKTLNALGVEIIEGEHPGSSYYAAELRQDVDYANQVAREIGLEFRFGQV